MALRILIVGGSGQTGSLLAKRLLSNDHEVIVSSRDINLSEWWRFDSLAIKDEVTRASINPIRLTEVVEGLTRFQPDVVYFLGGQTSVGASFNKPIETLESVTLAVAHFLDAINRVLPKAKFIHASSTEMFGNQPGQTLNELSALRPISPYGVAKASAHQLTASFRAAGNPQHVNAILTNHESPLRGEGFVTSKIFAYLKRLQEGEQETLYLGNIDVTRDWLAAEDVVSALTAMAASNATGDYLVASGISHSVRELLEEGARQLGVEEKLKIKIDKSLYRPNEIDSIHLNPEKIKSELGWSPKFQFEELVTSMLGADISILAGSNSDREAT